MADKWKIVHGPNNEVQIILNGTAIGYVQSFSLNVNATKDLVGPYEINLKVLAKDVEVVPNNSKEHTLQRHSIEKPTITEDDMKLVQEVNKLFDDI